MKKLRILFAAIGILSVTGGAIAFKAARFGASTYCINTDCNDPICPTKVTNKSFMAGSDIGYRRIPATASCTTNTLCTGCGRLVN